MGELESFGDSSSDTMDRALDAVSAFVHSLDATQGDMVQRFVLVVETIDQEDRWISAFTAPGQKVWDTLGLIEFARDMERACNDTAPSPDDD